MCLRGQKDRAPRDLFLIGLRNRHADLGIERREDDIDDVERFGIDWEDIDDAELIRELQERGENPFDDYAPDHMNEVPCEGPDCPLTDHQVQELDHMLQAAIDRDRDETEVNIAIWNRTLAWCRDLFNQVLLED